MTIFGPDISNNNGALTLATGTPFVLAKSSESTNYHDPTYAGFKFQAARIGALFSAYHFLHAGSAAAQARYAYGIVGKTPLMLDVELTGSSKPQLSDVTAFIDEYRAYGGNIWAAYIPHWYWQGDMGSPSLTPVSSRHVALISSSYTSYSDSGVGWNAYGGVSPALWQYTDSQAYSGKHVDFNAYKGTKAQLAALMGATSTADNGGIIVSTEQDTDMHIDIRPGQPYVCTPPAPVLGGTSAVCLSADFGSLVVRMATFSIKSKSWTVLPNFTVDSASPAVRYNYPDDVNKVSIEIASGSGALAADIYKV